MLNNTRSLSIDILKFFAVLLITNSHFDAQYVYAKELATGGAIGDALFFFCSGYTLFLGRLGRFDVWYKRRIRRIFPSVLVVVIIYGFMSPQLGLPDLLYYGANWFIPCILICYVPLYFIRKYAANRLNRVYIVIGCLILSWYSLFFEPIRTWFLTNCNPLDWMLFCTPMDKTWIYQWNYFKWLSFFCIMLFGAQMGRHAQMSVPANVSGRKAFIVNLCKLIGCIVVFYAIPMVIERIPELNILLLLTLFPLIGICYYFYRWAGTEVMLKLYGNKYIGATISVIGGLCLEIYLIQPIVRTTRLNHLFPLNLFIIFVGIVLAAYVCRSLARLVQQMLSEEDGFNWKAVFKLK